MDSFQQLPENLLRQRFAYYWWALSFQAGAINAGGFLSCGRSVSHVTGFGTQYGVQAMMGHWSLAWGLLSVPLFFLIGSVATTVLRVKSSHKHPSVAQGHVMFSIMSLLALVFGLGSFGFWGPFSAPIELEEHYLLLVLLSFVCGMQNALFSNTPSGVVRSTHLTGPLTDLGADLGRFFTSHKWSSREHEMFLCRGISILCFVLGGLVSAYFYLRHSYLGFALPLFTSFLLFVDAASWTRRHARKAL